MVKKLYLALAAAPVPRGIITHFMRPANLAPRLISERKNILLSVLVILCYYVCSEKYVEVGNICCMASDVVEESLNSV